ncbi:MAG: DUF4886 domain-containing protein [Clostridia bacterium]|nr:DUF4886 domain-containing protein [Clostridia bacterium]
MRRILALLMVLVTVLPLCVSCQTASLSQEEIAETTVTNETKEEKKTMTEETKTQEGYLPQSPFEQNVTKILVLGSSGSNDIFFHLARVFAAQGFPGRYTLAFLYYSGCSFDMHVNFGASGDAVYDYYESSSSEYTREEGYTMDRALKKHQWDMVLIQTTRADCSDETLHQKSRELLFQMVDRYVPTEHTFGYMGVWSNPIAPELWSDSWWRKPPETARKRFEDDFGFDPILQFNKNNEKVKQYILTDDRYRFVFSPGSAIMYAERVMGLSQLALYRDYTHLSDLGRIIGSYCFYAQFTGKPIEEVKLDVLPAKKRQAHYQADGDLVLNDTLKEVIKECANYALENPMTLPGA